MRNLEKKIKEKHLLSLKLKKKKVKTSKKQLKKFKNDENYEFIHLLIERHLICKALKEVNLILTKNNEGFLIDFSSKFHNFLENN